MNIGGIVLIVLGVILIIWHILSRKKTGSLLRAKVTTPSELQSMAQMLKGELEGGGMTEFVAITGTIECATPLISPLGERPCAYYKMEIKRKYEETRTTQDSEGNVRTQNHRGSQTMSTQSEGRDFTLVSGDGALPVRIDGLSHNALTETVDQFQPGGDSGASLSYGIFSMHVPTYGGGSRTLGYQYEEHILPLEGQFTVIGQVSDSSGTLALGRGGPIFSISRRSRDEQIGNAKTTAKWTSIGSGISLVAGATLLILHFVMAVAT
jgi:hypothetical protein